MANGKFRMLISLAVLLLAGCQLHVHYHAGDKQRPITLDFGEQKDAAGTLAEDRRE